MFLFLKIKSQNNGITRIARRYFFQQGGGGQKFGDFWDKKSWKKYADLMGKNSTWVDHILIQITTWCNLNILILNISSRSENPFIHIIANIKRTVSAWENCHPKMSILMKFLVLCQLSTNCVTRNKPYHQTASPRNKERLTNKNGSPLSLLHPQSSFLIQSIDLLLKTEENP